MDSILKDFLSSGRALVSDTKRPVTKVVKAEKASKKEVLGETETDPHKIFIRRTIKEKPPKKEVVEQIQRFIDSAEACL